MDRLHEVERAEREADEALYAVDPELARELGYDPPARGSYLTVHMGQMQNVAFQQMPFQQQLAQTAMLRQQYQSRSGSHLGGILGVLGALGARGPLGRY